MDEEAPAVKRVIYQQLWFLWGKISWNLTQLGSWILWLFFLKCCMQADIRRLKQRPNGLRSLVLLLQLQPLPFNHTNHNKWRYHECTAGLWMLLVAMLLVRDHGHVQAASLQFCFVKANDHNQQVCTYAKFSDLHFNHLSWQTDTPPSVSCISNEHTPIVKKVLLYYITKSTQNSGWKIHWIY